MNRKKRRLHGANSIGVMVFMLVLIGIFYWSAVVAQKDYTQVEFKEDVAEDRIKSVQVYQYEEAPAGYYKLLFKDDTTEKLELTDVNIYLDYLEENEVKYVVEGIKRESIFVTTIIPCLLILAVGIFFFFMVSGQNNGGGKMANFGKNKAKRMDPSAAKIDFSKVAGCHEEKEDLQEIVDFLKNPKKYIDLGA